MAFNENLEELFAKMERKLYTGVICDTLDELGYRNQAMKENLRPLSNDSVLVGIAKTIHAVDIYYVRENSYEKEIEAVDSIKPGEVVVASTNQSIRNGLWGELMSTASKMRGARGAIIDGLIRDTRKILELDFPVFCTGYKPVDSRGRGIVIDYDCRIEAGGVTVNPGDVIFADIDGVVVIPQEVFEIVVKHAFDKVERENSTRNELFEGKLLREVYDKYGVL
jgi:4-hydroxy-4-methyl-2-oxoglutarate aldolase